MHDDAGLHERYRAHFLTPRRQGGLDAPTHAGAATDPTCGDELMLELRVVAGRIEEAAFRVRGCSGAVAVGSALASLLPGRPAREDALGRADLEAELGAVPASKRHVLRLAVRVLAAALQGSSSIT